MHKKAIVTYSVVCLLLFLSLNHVRNHLGVVKGTSTLIGETYLSLRPDTYLIKDSFWERPQWKYWSQGINLNRNDLWIKLRTAWEKLKLFKMEPQRIASALSCTLRHILQFSDLVASATYTCCFLHIHPYIFFCCRNWKCSTNNKIHMRIKKLSMPVLALQ